MEIQQGDRRRVPLAEVGDWRKIDERDLRTLHDGFEDAPASADAEQQQSVVGDEGFANALGAEPVKIGGDRQYAEAAVDSVPRIPKLDVDDIEFASVDIG